MATTAGCFPGRLDSSRIPYSFTIAVADPLVEPVLPRRRTGHSTRENVNAGVADSGLLTGAGGKNLSTAPIIRRSSVRFCSTVWFQSVCGQNRARC